MSLHYQRDTLIGFILLIYSLVACSTVLAVEAIECPVTKLIFNRNKHINILLSNRQEGTANNLSGSRRSMRRLMNNYEKVTSFAFTSYCPLGLEDVIDETIHCNKYFTKLCKYIQHIIIINGSTNCKHTAVK
uniref:Uncharacterized protein n=1 Tax=Glossina brevipalpis TaxID=37001 RepID=A0A1A9WL97_9MUSC